VNSEDTILMWRTLERACAANNTDRARDMVHAIRELPQFRELGNMADSLLTLAECAECMAIAWEAGRAFQALRTEEWAADVQSAARHGQAN
jgi:hypothetical protein